MKFAISYCEIFDACVFLAILASLSYLISYGSHTPYENEREVEDEETVFPSAESLTTDDHDILPTSICEASPSDILQIAVELEYSKNAPFDLLTPAEVEETGDAILENLFNVRY